MVALRGTQTYDVELKDDRVMRRHIALIISVSFSHRQTHDKVVSPSDVESDLDFDIVLSHNACIDAYKVPYDHMITPIYMYIRT